MLDGDEGLVTSASGCDDVASRNGTIAFSIRAVSASITRVWASIWSRCSRAMNA